AILKRINELLVKDAAGVAPADYFSIKAWCALEQARTLARVPDAKARKAAEINLGLNAQQWDGLAKTYPWIPRYREQQAIALQARGLLRLKDKRTTEATADLDASRRLLEALTASHPQIAGYHADLGRTYAGLAQAAAAQDQQAEAARWASQGRGAFGKAV